MCITLRQPHKCQNVGSDSPAAATEAQYNLAWVQAE